MALAAGTRLGPYEVVGALGAGGMGEVYRARDTRLQRQVAIKTLPPHAAADPRFRERFDREARAVAALSHPNILAIHDVGSHNDVPYVAFELLEGETLRSRIGTAAQPLATVLDYARQIGRGLAAAHDRGIVHRDLKPANIFVTHDGHVKLLDFGLATEPIPESGADITRAPQTEPGDLLGTVGYMSPEQARGDRADARTDIFSFGCVLYEMLTGRRAFTGGDRVEILHAILKQHPPDVGSLRSDVPPALDRVVRRCLEKAPENRFQTARDLVFALETLADRSNWQTAAASPPGRTRPAWPLMPAMITAGALVIVVGALSWSASRDRPAANPASPTAAAPPAASPRRLLAVLPFANVSRDGEGYFAAGMTDEVTNQLSQLSGLRVVSRAAVAGFKDARADLPRMVQELGIGSVVTGTVREDGARVRVNVELLDATSGQVIWSDQYDREGVDVFAAQSDIALRVASALNASVSLEERARAGRPPTSSVAAYELYMRARGRQPGTSTEERLASRLDLLRKAVAIDPQFAEAYSDIANVHYFQGTYGDPSALPLGLEAANRALAINPDLASAHRMLALNLSQLGRLREALPEYRKAAALRADAGTLSDLSHGESTAGNYDEALKAGRRASELTGSGPGHYHVGVALLLLGDDARTERYLTMGLALGKGSEMRTRALMAFLDLRRGNTDAAVARINAAAVDAPDNIEVLLTRAEILTFAGAPDAAAVVRSLHARAAEGMFHNAPYPVKLAHAYHLHRAGSTRDAAAIMDRVLESNRQAIVGGADWPMAFLQNAAVYALRNQSAAALDEVERAYAAGWRDGRTLAIDPLVASLRDEPRFQAILARIEADVAAMRARADYSGLP